MPLLIRIPAQYGDSVVVAIRNVYRVGPHDDCVRMAAAVDVQSALPVTHPRSRFHDLSPRGVCRTGDVQDVDRRGFRDVRAPKAGDGVGSVVGDIPTADAIGVAELVGQAARVDLGDPDLAIPPRFVRIPGAGIAEWVVDIVVSGGIRWPQMRVLEHADVR